jgi:hypothetical protein
MNNVHHKQLELELQQEQQQKDLRSDINFTIGYPANTPPLKIKTFEVEMVQGIAREYQGLSVSRSKGYWIPDELMDDCYDPSVQVQEEDTFTINVSVYKHLESETIQFVSKLIEFNTDLVDLDGVEWIHCTVAEVKAKHFKVGSL